uniref:Uncharacterized protein n=1 Tax=Anguilla anguilla TaxID=7936 RepID=A0A0E9VQC6_ANGAN
MPYVAVKGHVSPQLQK